MNNSGSRCLTALGDSALCGEGRKSCPLSQHPHPPPSRKAKLPQTRGWGLRGRSAAGQGSGVWPRDGGWDFQASRTGGWADGQSGARGGEQSGARTLPAAALPTTTGVLVAESQLLLTLPPRCSGADDPHPLGPASGSLEGLDPLIPWSWSGRCCRAWSQVQGISPTPLRLTEAVSSPAK